MTNGSSTCNFSNVDVNLQQSGATFVGTHSGGTVTCTGPAGTFSSPLESGTILNGTVNGNAVAFDVDTPEFHLTGTLSGQSMSGTARASYNFGNPYGIVVLNGNWAATKQ